MQGRMPDQPGGRQRQIRALRVGIAAGLRVADKARGHGLRHVGRVLQREAGLQQILALRAGGAQQPVGQLGPDRPQLTAERRTIQHESPAGVVLAGRAPCCEQAEVVGGDQRLPVHFDLIEYPAGCVLSPGDGPAAAWPRGRQIDFGCRGAVSQTQSYHASRRRP